MTEEQRKEPEPRNVKLVLAYDGTGYQGWQSQKTGPTLQGVLEEKLRLMTGERIRVQGSGRTDAGVHALGQVAHFKTRSRLSAEAFQKGLNALLPGDILLREAADAAPDFHARYDARSKLYEYRVLNRREPDPFQRHYVWHIPRPLDRAAMDACLGRLVGEQDFSSFRSSGSRKTNPVRRVTRAELRVCEGALLCFRIEANGFLRHMVRNIVGTLAEVGAGKRGIEGFEAILASRDRRTAGIKAPPQGLFLVAVRY